MDELTKISNKFKWVHELDEFVEKTIPEEDLTDNNDYKALYKETRRELKKALKEIESLKNQIALNN